MVKDKTTFSDKPSNQKRNPKRSILKPHTEEKNNIQTRQHSSRMHTAHFPAVCVLVATTKCQYLWGTFTTEQFWIGLLWLLPDVSSRGCRYPGLMSRVGRVGTQVSSDAQNSGYHTMWHVPWCIWCTYSPQTEWLMNRCLWKHYLPAISFVGSNECYNAGRKQGWIWKCFRYYRLSINCFRWFKFILKPPYTMLYEIFWIFEYIYWAIISMS